MSYQNVSTKDVRPYPLTFVLRLAGGQIISGSWSAAPKKEYLYSDLISPYIGQSFASVSWSVPALNPRCDLAQARQNHCDNSPSISATELRILWGEVRIAEKAQAAECSSPGRHKPKARQNYEKPDSSHPIVLLSNIPSTKERMNINKKII